MKVFEYDEVDKNGYEYLVKFNRTPANMKNHTKFNDLLNKISDKKFDLLSKAWLVKKSGFDVLNTLNNEDVKRNRSNFQSTNKTDKSPNIIQKVTEKSITGWENIGTDMKLAPYEYQKKVIKFSTTDHDGYSTLIVSPCGSGKTIIGINAFIEAIKNGIIKGPGLIVVKASLKIQWKKEIEKFTDLSAGIIETYRECISKDEQKLKRKEAKLKTAEYDYRDELIQEIEELKKEISDKFNNQFLNKDLLILNYETLNDENVRLKLIEMKLEYIFADEVQYVKSAAAKRSKSLCELKAAKIKIGATATPVQRDPSDIYGIFKFIKPGLFKNKTTFNALYIRYGYNFRIIGAKNEKQLNQKIDPYMYILTKEEVSSQLPKLVVMQRYCDFSAKQQELNDKVMDEIEELQEKEKIVIEGMTEEQIKGSPEAIKLEAAIGARQTFLQEMTLSEKLFELSDSDMAKKFITGSPDSKMELLCDLVSEIIESGEKVCIFSRFKRMQPIITDYIYKTDGLKHVKIAYINGSLSPEQRYEEAYTKFKDDDNFKILICSDAGAEGLNLSCCKYLIELDLAISYAIQTQRHGRLERADSIHDTVFVYQLIMNNSWDEIALKVVNKKEKYDMSIIKGVPTE